MKTCLHCNRNWESKYCVCQVCGHSLPSEYSSEDADDGVFAKPEIYKAGDWVEYDGKQYRINEKSLIDSSGLIMYNGVIWRVPDKSKFRKLRPSEVIIDFGSFSGTIVGCGDIEPKVKVFNGVDWIATVLVSALDENTRERAKDLLKAQEEK